MFGLLGGHRDVCSDVIVNMIYKHLGFLNGAEKIRAGDYPNSEVRVRHVSMSGTEEI